ncbi:MAG: hypothetical protein ABSD13_13195 [Candidatus Korobacteraceae bacterium]|jgi:hypothetical protein
MLSRKPWRVIAELCAIAIAVCWAVPSSAQIPEVKEKPAMYSYVSFWAFPRAQWTELKKSNAADRMILDKALSSGSIVGYGNDTNLIHQPDGSTHDDWWSAMSMAGVLNVLDHFYQSGTTTSPLLASATKHWDGIFVSRYYNWHSGSWKGAYTHGSSYKLKPDAPDDAVEKLSKHLIAPLLEKLLADGTLVEYEVDTEAVHTEAPGTFWIFYLTPNAEGLDKTNAAIRETFKTHPLAGPAFDSMVDFTPHRDYLARTNATYK